MLALVQIGLGQVRAGWVGFSGSCQLFQLHHFNSKSHNEIGLHTVCSLWLLNFAREKRKRRTKEEKSMIFLRLGFEMVLISFHGEVF